MLGDRAGPRTMQPSASPEKRRYRGHAADSEQIAVLDHFHRPWYAKNESNH